MPACIRRYPFWAAQLEGATKPALLFDAWWHGFFETEGAALYDADGQPSPRLVQAIQFVEGGRPQGEAAVQPAAAR
ncbi:MAG: SapC family protein [Pseudomonadota bacterium]